jgi:hypothetical protein
MVTMPKAYVIGEVHVRDPETLKEYRDKVLETVEAFGGRSWLVEMIHTCWRAMNRWVFRLSRSSIAKLMPWRGGTRPSTKPFTASGSVRR